MEFISILKPGLMRGCIIAFVIGVSLVALPGCNTVRGAGEDLSGVGQAIEKTANTVEEELTGSNTKPAPVEDGDAARSRDDSDLLGGPEY